MVINASWKIKAKKKDMEILLAHTARWGLAFRHVGLHGVLGFLLRVMENGD